MKIQMLFLFITLTTCTPSHGQDGSDILYINVDRLDESYMGDLVHLDFYNRSFRGKSIDTITIAIDDRSMKFIEHREDTGFNNWFDRQYLESLEKMDGFRIRITKSRLDKITTDSVFVTNILTYYKNDELLSERSRQITNAFPRASVAEVLVSAGSHKRQRSK